MHLPKSPAPTTAVLKRLMQETSAGTLFVLMLKFFINAFIKVDCADYRRLQMTDVETEAGTLYMDVYAAPICRIFKSKIQVKP